MRRAALCALTAAALLAGCATAQRPDPLEPLNRKVFAFNEAVDSAVLKPTAEVYRAVLPTPAQIAVSNFFGNLKDAWSAVNLLLQGRVADSLSDVMRVGTNTVFGFMGVMDIATELGFERHGEDFGQTLGRWGVPPGPYLVLPIFGPSTLRDTVGMGVEAKGDMVGTLDNVPNRNALTALRLVEKRAGLLRAGTVLDEAALDKYSFSREIFLQRRQSVIDAQRNRDDE